MQQSHQLCKAAGHEVRQGLVFRVGLLLEELSLALMLFDQIFQAPRHLCTPSALVGLKDFLF